MWFDFNQSQGVAGGFNGIIPMNAGGGGAGAEPPAVTATSNGVARALAQSLARPLVRSLTETE